MLFDAYLMVNWTGGATRGPRRPAKDSVWVGEHWDGGASQRYFRTRASATAHVRERLLAHVAEGGRVLVGFDFPYGYPKGFAAALGLTGDAPWRAVWDLLGATIEDDDANANNRFEVAAVMNERLGGPGPFWGCPESAAGPFLTTRMTGIVYPFAGLDRHRVTEMAMAGVQETWKLFGNGSVGSQALMGIPRVRCLRDDPDLAAVSRVWPFETGLTDRPGPGIVHAEIWPGIVAVPGDAPIRDQAQVRLMCEWAAGHDAAGTLGAWFAPALDPATAAAVVGEEGWILGGASAAQEVRQGT